MIGESGGTEQHTVSTHLLQGLHGQMWSDRPTSDEFVQGIGQGYPEANYVSAEPEREG